MNTRSIMPIKQDALQLEAIISAVSSVWGIEPKILLGRSRERPVAFARHLCMALAYEMTNMTQVAIGLYFGKRHHTSVLHATIKVSEFRRDKDIKPLIQEVISKLKPKQTTPAVHTPT